MEYLLEYESWDSKDEIDDILNIARDEGLLVSKSLAHIVIVASPDYDEETDTLPNKQFKEICKNIYDRLSQISEFTLVVCALDPNGEYEEYETPYFLEDDDYYVPEVFFYRV